MRQIFISHRHADKAIATVIRKEVENWCQGEIECFQSSDPEHGALLGEPLDKSLKDALAKAQVVFLIYTFADEDWAYGMYEVGIATDPEQERARIVVFQCTDDVPKVLQSKVRVHITEEQIFRFTEQFHKTPSFFPSESAVAPEIPNEALKDRSEKLYKALREVIPRGKLEERYRWDRLTLGLSREPAMQVRKKQLDESVAIIKGEAEVLSLFGRAVEHFGFDAVPQNRKFSVLVGRWKQWAKQERTDRGIEIPEEWIHGLYSEMWRAVQKMPSEPVWEYMRSAVAGADWWFLIIVNHVRVHPDDRVEFDIFLYRKPTNN